MKRRLAQFTLAVGVLLSVIALLAIVRGFRATDFWMVTLGRTPAPDARVGDRFVLVTSHSLCAIVVGRTREQITTGPMRGSVDRFNASHEAGPPRPFYFLPHEAGSLWRRLRFEVIGWEALATPMLWGTMDRREAGLIVPTWFVALLAATMTFFPARFLRRDRRRRRAAGQCLACGYDLRGAAHERCPECGNAVVVAQV